MEVIKVGVGDFATTLRLASGPKLLKDGTPAKSGFALSDKAAKQLIDTLAESGALVKKRQADKLVFIDTQLEDGQ